MFFGKSLAVDDDQQVIVGTIAADAIFHPIAAGIGPIENDLEDPAAIALCRQLGRLELLDTGSMWSVSVKAASKPSA